MVSEINGCMPKYTQALEKVLFFSVYKEMCLYVLVFQLCENTFLLLWAFVLNSKSVLEINACLSSGKS